MNFSGACRTREGLNLGKMRVARGVLYPTPIPSHAVDGEGGFSPIRSYPAAIYSGLLGLIVVLGRIVVFTWFFSSLFPIRPSQVSAASRSQSARSKPARPTDENAAEVRMSQR